MKVGQLLPEEMENDPEPYFIFPIHNLQYFMGYFIVSPDLERLNQLNIKSWLVNISSMLENWRVKQKLKITVERLENLYMTDMLTGLYNRRGYGNHFQTYYEESLKNKSSIAVFLIDMDNRELFISTSGDAIYYLTDERLDSILDTAYEYVSEERYADVFRAMINQTSEYYSRGIDEQQYTFDRDTGKIVYYREPKRISLLEGILAAAAGLLSALGLGGAVKSKYNMKSGKYSYSLAGNSDLRLSNRQDVFVRKFVSSRNIPKNPPSSGGRSSGGYSRPHRSTIHTGSGGHTFGGRGRKF